MPFKRTNSNQRNQDHYNFLQIIKNAICLFIEAERTQDIIPMKRLGIVEPLIVRMRL